MQEPEPVSKQPGDSISSEALKKLAAMAVASGRQQELAQLAASLVDAPSECIFVMPSLLGMMLTGPIGPPGARVQPLLTMFGKTSILAEYQGDYQDVLQGGSDLDGSLAGSNRLLQSGSNRRAAIGRRASRSVIQQAASVGLAASSNTRGVQGNFAHVGGTLLWGSPIFVIWPSCDENGV
jgi:hypothetical protein